MNTAWQTFTQQRLSQASSATAEMVLSPLPPTAALAIRGGDAETFLQGQTTCDVRQITSEQSGLGAFCNPQGRVIATFRILRDETGFLLLLSADLAEKVAQRLRLYVLRSDVIIETADVALFGLTLASAAPLQERLQPLPRTVEGVTRVHQLHWIKMPGPGERFLILGTTEAARSLWFDLAENRKAAERPATDWQLQDIHAGLPTVTAATSEEFLPQMLNLDALGGIGFDKGCYTGQEVVARTHYRGQVKRRLYRARLAAHATPTAGMKLQAKDKTVGQVVNAAPTDSEQELLAVVHCDRAHRSEIHLADQEALVLRWLELPYTIA
ncbi:MAG: YgfZ/GcvT domain-containing protein [Methylohalobius sp. ZOD2]